MKRILLVIFSGTGNTLLAARMIGDNFTALGHRAEILEMDKQDGQNIDGASWDIIGLGYPVYAFNIPVFFLKYVKSLNLEGKEVFIFKTSGEPTSPSRAASRGLAGFLKKSVFLGDYHFLMPYNIIFRFPDNLIKQMYRRALGQSRILAENILAGRVSFIRCGPFQRFIAFIFKIQRFGAGINGILYSVDRKRCSLCMVCLKNCPAGNIRFKDGKFRFGFGCFMCMRCAFRCPADALHIGLLDRWRVNGDFRFKDLDRDESLDGRFITAAARGLYRIYVPWLAD